MKIEVAQLNYIIGDIEGNQQKILQILADSSKQTTDLVIFSELAICGYPPKDLLEFPAFIDQCIAALEHIAKNCDPLLHVIIGGPSRNASPQGKKLYNSAYYIHQNTFKIVHHKWLLPTYDVFDEYRYFEPGNTLDPITIHGKKVGITICEDLWNVENTQFYTQNPLGQAKELDLIVNISASPFHVGHDADRKKILAIHSKKIHTPIIYVNQVGAHADLIFDGGSMVVNATGTLIKQLPFFEEKTECFDLNDLLKQGVDTQIPQNTELIYQALLLGIKDYFHKNGFQKAVLGLSGGIDSALVLCLAAKALGKENVLPVLMPSEYSSPSSIDDSVLLCKHLGMNYETVPIQNIFTSFNQELAGLFQNKPFDVTEENLQARTRGTILMAISNKFGRVLLNTTNKSEAAVGYGTLYGDMCGGLAVLGDVYKTEIYELARYINKNEEIIPINIIEKAPSAELRPDQKDSDSLPEYELLDQILKLFIEEKMSVEQLINKGFDKVICQKIITLVCRNEYKRYQFAPILRVSKKSFGSGWDMPLVAKAAF